MKETCWVLTGPTASGKTALSLRLARTHDCEIVCMDSMQIYRGMDIGTAKPTADERAQAVHHMVDVADPTEDFFRRALSGDGGKLHRGHSSARAPGAACRRHGAVSPGAAAADGDGRSGGG